MDPDTALFPSSPTNSSPSSSDLDTESTGSFFPDRSTTLGTLMGVNFPSGDPAAGPARVPSRREAISVKKAAEAERRRRRRSWWRLCRDDMVGPTTSLGEFLQVERRAAAGADAAAAAAGGFFVAEEGEHVAVGSGRLFENGRVLPPPQTAATAVERRRRERVPVLLAGICSSGEG